jgi:hypothetical protein
MIRNHLIDPESSPMKGQSSEPLPSYPLNNYQNNPNTLDDPWYTHSDTNSPSTNTNQNPSYSNYGYGVKITNSNYWCLRYFVSIQGTNDKQTYTNFVSMFYDNNFFYRKDELEYNYIYIYSQLLYFS